ncbi:hypothetical protein [Paenibacillus sp. V4I5]|uniref:hypothetical protein n=1 Tax=Paenibacillus sp. V4I5 TaxID=3042306 RepID=UPI0027947A7F|nr:hypothetical protein [Paenibacillus sp. V4I5]MDQ0914438.1 hypothetical protein [Paenibacillus sp. V4I5]
MIPGSHRSQDQLPGAIRTAKDDVPIGHVILHRRDRYYFFIMPSGIGLSLMMVIMTDIRCTIFIVRHGFDAQIVSKIIKNS